jgi:glyoxylase-like metal-dependent hydrolase (beta-lactamase superfamily II)
VVLSHLHLDHAGGLEFFRGREILLTELKRERFYD